MISLKTSLSGFDDKRLILNDGQHTLPYGHKNILGQTAIVTDGSDDNTAAANSDLDGVSEKFANTQNVDRGIRKLMMTTLMIVLLLKMPKYIVRFDNWWTRSIAFGELRTKVWFVRQKPTTVIHVAEKSSISRSKLQHP